MKYRVDRILHRMQAESDYSNREDTFDAEKQPSNEHVVGENIALLKLGKDGMPLEPQPADDPFDPLNFSTTNKVTILLAVCFITFVGTTNMVICAPAFPQIFAELPGVTPNTISYATGAPLLSYGIASFFYVALANRIGVRSCFLWGSFIAGFMALWGAEAKTFASYVVARTLTNAFLAQPECLGPQMIGDVFFLKHRAMGVAFICTMQASGNVAGAIFGGYLAQSLGWQWTQWFMTILCFVGALLAFFFIPETTYARQAAQEHRQRKRTIIDHFRFWPTSGGGPPKSKHFFRELIRPFKYMAHPLVVIAIFYFSVYLMCTAYLLTSNAFIYPTIYGYDVGTTGLVNIAPLIGVWLGSIYGGTINDYAVARARKRSATGIFTPEMRLPYAVVPFVCGPVGLIMTGVIVQNGQNAIASLVGEAICKIELF